MAAVLSVDHTASVIQQNQLYRSRADIDSCAVNSHI